jgi:Domain of unknown function (DUF3850)
VNHELKTHPNPFAAVLDGRKRFELRVYDRPYQVGDTLQLREWDSDNGYSGREYSARVTYMLECDFGLPKGYVCMSIEPEGS